MGNISNWIKNFEKRKELPRQDAIVKTDVRGTKHKRNVVQGMDY